MPDTKILAVDMSPSYFVSRSETTLDFYLMNLLTFLALEYNIKYSFKRANSEINAL